MTTEHEELHRDLGVYVLGALEPAERDRFERHLAGCAICRDEVTDLAVLPSLLGRLGASPEPLAAPSFTPIIERLAAQRRHTRRRERILAAVAALAAVIAITVVVLDPRVGSEVAGRVYASEDGTVTATVQDRPWGMAVHIAAEQLPPGPGFVANAVARDGHVTQVASWSETGAPVTISGACYLDADDVTRVEILDPRDEKILVVLNAES